MLRNVKCKLLLEQIWLKVVEDHYLGQEGDKGHHAFNKIETLPYHNVLYQTVMDVWLVCKMTYGQHKQELKEEGKVRE